MDTASLLTTSLRNHPQGRLITATLAAALEAVDPARAVKRCLQRSGNRLQVGEHSFSLKPGARVFLVGTGKAGAPMALAAADILGPHLSQGVVIVKDDYTPGPEQPLPPRLEILPAGHPVPDRRGQEATRHMLKLLDATQTGDLVLALISGGGSALLTSPAGDVSLADLQRLTSAFLACGASITEINTLRKHLDDVKGGGLARAAVPAHLATLILSDVVGSPLDIIASGPTVPDSSTFNQALDILQRYRLIQQTPPGILSYLHSGQAGDVPETPKPGDSLFSNVVNLLIGDNRQAAQAALEHARQAGLNTMLLTTYLEGEARQVGGFLAAIGRELAHNAHPLPRPACIVLGGETTVTLLGDGHGGRNQELALSAVPGLAGLPDIFLVTLATDGGDGPTDAAGAVVSGSTMRRAQEMGLNPRAFLTRNDAYHFFAPLGDLLKPGPTQTNVNDLAFIFAF